MPRLAVLSYVGAIPYIELCKVERVYKISRGVVYTRRCNRRGVSMSGQDDVLIWGWRYVAERQHDHNRSTIHWVD